MKTFTKITLIGIYLISLLGSCTVQKRRYSSGYHISWHRSKKTVSSSLSKPKTQKIESKTLKPSITTLYAEQKINLTTFASKYPRTKTNFLANSSNHKSNIKNHHTLITQTYLPTPIDTQLFLTTAEVKNNYFIDSSGKKKKYRRGLKNLLIFGGLGIALFGLGVLPIALLGLSALIIGIALPKPNKTSLVASNSQLVKSKNDNKTAAAVGISILLVSLIIVVGVIVVIGLVFAF